ncbi:hypothetical protein Tco_1108061 [Tanacetum coccineum]
MGSLQMDDDDEISNLVDLYMYVLCGGWKWQELLLKYLHCHDLLQIHATLNPAANDKAFTSHASGEKSTPTSNAFDALNSEEGAEFGDSNPIIEMAHVDEDAQNLKSGTEEAVKEQQRDNLWSKFKPTKEASKNNPRYSSVVEDSEEDEVYCSNAEYTSRVGSGFSMDEDDLDGFDGYEAQVYS